MDGIGQTCRDGSLRIMPKTTRADPCPALSSGREQGTRTHQGGSFCHVKDTNPSLVDGPWHDVCQLQSSQRG